MPLVVRIKQQSKRGGRKDEDDDDDSSENESLESDSASAESSSSSAESSTESSSSEDEDQEEEYDEEDDDTNYVKGKLKSMTAKKSKAKAKQPLLKPSASVLGQLDAELELEELVARRENEKGTSFDYLCKWKNISYLHLDWMEKEDLLEMFGTRVKVRLSKFDERWGVRERERKRRAQYLVDMAASATPESASASDDAMSAAKTPTPNQELEESEEVFEDDEDLDESNAVDPSYVDIDRLLTTNVLDSLPQTAYEGEVYDLPPKVHVMRRKEWNATKHPDEQQVKRRAYLVKWRGLSYTRATWEWEELVSKRDDAKIADYHRFEKPPHSLNTPAPPPLVPATAPSEPESTPEEPVRSSAMDSLSNLLPVYRDLRSKLAMHRFNKAKTEAHIASVPVGLKNYVLQAEACGMPTIGDEIICVNGVSVEGTDMTSFKAILASNKQTRVLRFFRRETNEELEVSFEPTKILGIALGSPHLPSAAMNGDRDTIRYGRKHYSVRIRDWLIPRAYLEKGGEQGNCVKTANVSLSVRSIVTSVFAARDACSSSSDGHLTLAKLAREADVEETMLEAWFGLTLPERTGVQRVESALSSWVSRCATAFNAAPTDTPIQEIEAWICTKGGAVNPLPEAWKSSTNSVQEAIRRRVVNARTRLAQKLSYALDELNELASRFEQECKRQLREYDGAIPEVATKLSEVVEKLKNAYTQIELEAEQTMRNKRTLAARSKRQTQSSIRESIESPYVAQVRRIRDMREGEKFNEYQKNTMRFKNGNTLREYQMQGLNWMISKMYSGTNCILADEMGLGKTVQVVAFLEHLRTKESLRGPFLVIAPLSTLGHWRREFANWTDANVCHYYDTSHGAVTGGAALGREMIRNYEWYYEALNRRQDTVKFNVMVTSYETFLSDAHFLQRLPFVTLVLDEAHRIKNQNSRLATELKRMDKTVQHKLLLTGTPLQNDLEELWALLHFCDPARFKTFPAFQRIFGNELKSGQDVDALQSVIQPYMLRRVKETVEKAIPPKEETIIDCDLTLLQKRYYKAVFEGNRTFLYRGCKSNNKPQLIHVEIELRKCCNHPYIIRGVRERELGERSDTVIESLPFAERQAMANTIVRASGKLVVVDKLLVKLRSEGRKVLIFSQMLGVLDLLGELCRARDYAFERLDGSVQGNVRQASIDRFSSPNSDSFVFLLSTRAGGVGINLTAADTVIIYDSDWNPQNDAQAQARAHRIGQTKPVQIYRLITKHTYEEVMFNRASKKLGVERALLGSGKFTPNTNSVSGKDLTPAELELMLREGAYYHLKSTNEASDLEGLKSEEDTFCELDIETILATRTRKIKVDTITGGIQAGETAVDLGPAAAEANVNLTDRDFWTKLIAPEEDAQSLLSRLTGSGGAAELASSDTKRTAFVRRAKELAQEILEEREKGEIVDDHRMDTTVALLIQMSNLTKVFPLNVQDQVTTLMAQIEASKERRSKVRTRDTLARLSQFDKKQARKRRRLHDADAVGELPGSERHSSEEEDDDEDDDSEAEDDDDDSSEDDDDAKSAKRRRLSSTPSASRQTSTSSSSAQKFKSSDPGPTSLEEFLQQHRPPESSRALTEEERRRERETAEIYIKAQKEEDQRRREAKKASQKSSETSLPKEPRPPAPVRPVAFAAPRDLAPSLLALAPQPVASEPAPPAESTGDAQ